MNILSESNSKICSRCKKLKPFNCFHKSSKSLSGFRVDCKECRAKDGAKYYLENSEKIKTNTKIYRLKNPEKCKEMNKKYFAENPEKKVHYSKKYRLANKDKLSANNKKYHLNNKERRYISGKQWRKNNPDRCRNYRISRRAQKLANGIYKVSIKEIQKLYQSPCIYCGSSNLIEIDHVIPISRGGQHSIGNLVPACKKCNRNKSNKLIVEWKNQ